ncbi:hypothetical protein ACOME3_002242 [Neoechinorhynchus agilis]
MPSGRRNRVVYSNPDAPKFIKEFKERSGYVEPSTIDDKLPTEMTDDDCLPERQDELPQVVFSDPDIIKELKEHNTKTINDRPVFNIPLSMNTKTVSGKKERIKMHLLSFADDEQQD